LSRAIGGGKKSFKRNMGPNEAIWILIHHRLADIYSRYMGDNQAAVSALEEIIARYPIGHKYYVQARGRIELLKK